MDAWTAHRDDNSRPFLRGVEAIHHSSVAAFCHRAPARGLFASAVRGRSSKEFRMSAPDQPDAATDNQDATDPNNLLYYAPRHLRDRANALRTKQFECQAIEIRTRQSRYPQS